MDLHNPKASLRQCLVCVDQVDLFLGIHYLMEDDPEVVYLGTHIESPGG